MWNKSGKDEETKATVTTGSTGTPVYQQSPAKTVESPKVAGANKAVIGKSILVKGEISGNEDLLIEGTVEGTVELKQNVVTVGDDGQIKGNIFGCVIHIRGEVNGDCFAGEQVIVHTEAIVNGNITAPRMTLEDGAHFKGSIDTNGKNKEAQASKADTKSNKSASSSTETRATNGSPASAVM